MIPEVLFDSETRGLATVDGQIDGGFVVAIDGPAGSGKSTVARTMASRTGASYLDTGAMYRAATWAVLNQGIALDDPDTIVKVVECAQIEVGTDPVDPRIGVDGQDVAVAIRSQQVTSAVSAVAAVPGVRALLVAQQRAIIEAAGRVVVEGRDIGQVVAPDANLKVYLTASAEERARRRSVENRSDQAATEADLRRRDKIDSTRATDPLRRGDDAIEVDSTGMGIDQVVDHLLGLLATAVNG